MQCLLCYQWGLFERQFGRADAQDPDPEGKVPVWAKASVKEMKDKFSAVGLGPRQVFHIFDHYFSYLKYRKQHTIKDTMGAHRENIFERKAANHYYMDHRSLVEL